MSCSGSLTLMTLYRLMIRLWYRRLDMVNHSSARPVLRLNDVRAHNDKVQSSLSELYNRDLVGYGHIFFPCTMM